MFRKSNFESSDRPARGKPVAVIDPFDPENEVTSAIAEITSASLRRGHPGANAGESAGRSRDEPSIPRSTDEEALSPGYRLGNRFEIVSLVHSSGMSNVYKAIDTRRRLSGSEQNYVAIKMMRPALEAYFDGRLALQREAAKTQCLSHPNIVNIFDFDQHEDKFYLVLEWLAGESVSTLLRRTGGRPVARQFAWRVIEGVVNGLEHAHAHNVVHADINPSNIFITDTQDIKILDFGVARYASGPASDVDKKGIWATRSYSSPEVLAGSAATFEDDVFSLACVAYRLLTGAHPFAGMSAIEAQKAHMTVEPVPGLPDKDWQTLSSALSYERTERPRTPIAFFSGLPAAHSGGLVEQVRSRWQARWVPVLLAAAIVLVGGASLYWSAASLDKPTVNAETASLDQESSADIYASPVPARLEQLLINAAQAIDEQRLLVPEGNSARDIYRQVLLLDETNSAAFNGLRTISDVYVRMANDALRDNAPTVAIAALADAAETDPQNPSIAIVTELLVAQGNSQLANARLAAAEGDTDRAAELLSSAQHYAHIEVKAIDEVRDQIAQSEDERQFLGKLATVEAHIVAGRLTVPDGDNALASLLVLQGERDGDPRLLGLMQQLGDRLIARAATASAGREYAEAGELLDAADALGVLSSEVGAARESLQRARELTIDAGITAAETADEPDILPSDEPNTLPADEAALAASVTEVATPPQLTAAATFSLAVENDPGATSPVSANTESVSVAGAIADSGISEIPQPRQVSLSDLAIEKYVAPRFPRRAERRGQTGHVEIRFSIYTDGTTGNVEILDAQPRNAFEASAENAVKKWRFAPREDVIRSRVTLRFERPPES